MKNYQFTQFEAEKIKELLRELRSPISSSAEKSKIRTSLRNNYDFHVSDFEKGFTDVDFEKNILSKKFTIVEEKNILDQIYAQNHQILYCPYCNASNFIDNIKCKEISILNCYSCGKTFTNPIGTSNKGNHNLIWAILIILLILWISGKVSMQKQAGNTETFEQSDRTEIYYHDKNGNVIKRETIYKDGRPTVWKDYYQ